MNSVFSVVLLVLFINAAFSRWTDDAEEDYYRRRSFRDSMRNKFMDTRRIPLPSDYDEVSDSQVFDSEHDDPHKYRPITLPLRDAIRYVRKYGPQAQKLQRLDDDFKNRRFSDARKMFLQVKREEMHCTPRKEDKECERHVNGCGSGFSADIPFIFRSLFTPCCNKHDVCYDCGKTDQWTKDQCDNSFYNDMENQCLCNYPEWSQTLVYQACKLWAKTLWEVVHVFGGQYFIKDEQKFCKNECIIPFGSPNMTLLV